MTTLSPTGRYTVVLKNSVKAKKKEIIIASQRDAEIFVNAILNPAPPNAALLAAAQKYKELHIV